MLSSVHVLVNRYPVSRLACSDSTPAQETELCFQLMFLPVNCNCTYAAGALVTIHLKNLRAATLSVAQRYRLRFASKEVARLCPLSA